jgi:glycosyltransferase involved in cell wall biosynthesis
VAEVNGKFVKDEMGRPLILGLMGEGSGGWIGGVEYIRNLVLAIRAAGEGTIFSSRFVVFLEGGGQEYRNLFAGIDGVRFIDLPQRRPSLVGRVRHRMGIPAKDRSFERLCQSEGIDFLYPYDGRLGAVGCRSAAWIPDLQHHRLPEYFSPAELEVRTRRFRQIATECEAVVFSSQSSLNDFRTFYPEATAEASVVPFRVSIDPAALEADPWETVTRYQLPRKFLLVSNQFWQHKNHPLLLEAIAKAKSELPDLVVAMTGRLNDYRRPAFADEVMAKIQTLGIHQQVRLLGLIPKRDQMQLLRAAHAMVQPSLFEGWNTGVEEARLLGKVVLLSRIDVHVEQSPPGCMFFEPRDVGDLAGRLKDVWAGNREEWSRDKETQAVEEYRQLAAEYGRQVLGLASSGMLQDGRDEADDKRRVKAVGAAG